MNASRGDNADQPHKFGGNWTTEKLEILGEYLRGYTTALKKQPFSNWYIDAYAGTGTRQHSREQPALASSNSLSFEAEEQHDANALFDGSARVALKTSPTFDRYVFIEKDPHRCAQLLALETEFPALAARIRVMQMDANLALQSLDKWDNQTNLAVVFLDPYGMDVEWKTITAIAATRAIDLWVLIPLGMGLVRLLTCNGEIPDG